MSSLATSSPVSASTLAYLIRWPVFRLSWLNEIFSLSEVAGYSATGQVTRDRRRKPFQFARGAMYAELHFGGGSDFKTNGSSWFRQRARPALDFILTRPAAPADSAFGRLTLRERKENIGYVRRTRSLRSHPRRSLRPTRRLRPAEVMPVGRSRH